MAETALSPVTPTPDSPVPAATRRSRLRAVPERAVVAGVAALAWILYIVSTRRSYYFFDDYWWIFDTTSRKLNWDNLRVGNYGHFAPVTRLGYFTVNALFGMRWRPASLVISMLVVAVVFAIYRLAKELGASRAFATVGAVAMALSPVVLHVSQWWGGAMHVFGGLIGSTWTAIQFLRWQRTGQRRHYILSLLTFAGALFVQERPLVVLAALLLFSVCPPSKGWAMQPVHHAIQVAPHVALGVTYLVWYTSNYHLPDAPRPSLTAIGEFVKEAAVDNFGPLTFGIQPARLGGWATVVGLIALAVWVAVTLVGSRRRDVRVGVALIVGMWVANFGILAYGRLGLNGPAIADDLQYHADALLWFIAPTAALVSGSRVLRNLPLRLPSFVPPALIVALAALIIWPRVLSYDSWAGLGRYARRYMAPVSTGVDELRASLDRFELLPLDVPETIFPAWVPLDQPQLVGLFELPPPSTPGALIKFAFDAYGNLRRVQPIYVDVVDLEAPSDPDRNRVVVADADVLPTDRGLCMTGVGDMSSLSVPFPSDVNVTPTLVTIDYQADDAGPLFIASVDAEGTFAMSPVVERSAGTWQSILPLPIVTTPTSLVIAGPAVGASLCIQRIAFVAVVAQPIDPRPACELLDPTGQPLTAPNCGEPWAPVSQ